MPRLDRAIQYAAASRPCHNRRGVLDRPVEPGDDSRDGRASPAFGDIADTLRALRRKTALTFAQIATT
ncbi:hypothetical protein CO669_34150 [Bradyrhizobium sp. Y36]|nr:hypothetical protein CO669_34150 [Bradyrhizobium sp. Y36]